MVVFPDLYRESFGLLSNDVAVLVKGYPRLSETFISQEILALERLGLDLEIVSLRRPTDGRVEGSWAQASSERRARA